LLTSGAGLVSSGFAAWKPWRPKSGNCGIWFVNMSLTVSGLRICLPVFGEVPSFSSVARTSVVWVSVCALFVSGRKEKGTRLTY